GRKHFEFKITFLDSEKETLERETLPPTDPSPVTLSPSFAVQRSPKDHPEASQPIIFASLPTDHLRVSSYRSSCASLPASVVSFPPSTATGGQKPLSSTEASTVTPRERRYLASLPSCRVSSHCPCCRVLPLAYREYLNVY
ncbi:hypothetical protein V8G54_003218, partial [Vigna mungo]